MSQDVGMRADVNAPSRGEKQTATRGFVTGDRKFERQCGARAAI